MNVASITAMAIIQGPVCGLERVSPPTLSAVAAKVPLVGRISGYSPCRCGFRLAPEA
jgi:hypothetical protein